MIAPQGVGLNEDDAARARRRCRRDAADARPAAADCARTTGAPQKPSVPAPATTARRSASAVCPAYFDKSIGVGSQRCGVRDRALEQQVAAVAARGRVDAKGDGIVLDGADREIEPRVVGHLDRKRRRFWRARGDRLAVDLFQTLPRDAGRSRRGTPCGTRGAPTRCRTSRRRWLVGLTNMCRSWRARQVHRRRQRHRLDFRCRA